MHPQTDRRTHSKLWAGLMLAILCAPVCRGQFETAAVLGTVLDPHGGAVPKAHVSLENLDTGVRQAASTDERGAFEFLEVHAGRYKVSAQAAGFKRAETQEFRVEVSARQRVDVNLDIGEVDQTVEVRGTASMVQSESSDRGQVIDHSDVENLPLNGRDTASLALLSTGVRLSYGLSKREASFNVNGMRSQLNDFILDGVDNNAYGTSNQGLSNQVVQVSPDALQEFKVTTNAYSAEYGHVGGAVINASVRSGTNEIHGSLWDYLRNTDLNATGFFKPAGGAKPVYIFNQFGGTLGAPVKKNKAFAFIDYEGFQRMQRSLSTTSVPTLAQRAGNFSGMAVIDPLSGTTYPNGIIPATALSKFATTVFNALPAPNLPGNTSNFSYLAASPDQDNKFDLRYDHYLSSKLTVFGRYSYHLYNQTAGPAVPGPSGQGAGIISRVMNWQAATGATWVIGPTSLLEFRLGVSKTEGMKTPATLDGKNEMLDIYGITGLPTDPAIAGGLTTQNITGYTSYGRDYTSPQWQNPVVINPKLNYSKILSRHTLKAGYEFQAINTTINDFNPAYGQNTYGGQFTNPTPTKSNNIYNLADFLLGDQSVYQLTNFTQAHQRQRMDFAYLQDDFKVSPRLTLNLGIRYEFATPEYERENRMTNYNPATNSLVNATDGSLFDRALVHPRYKDFAPRVGLAYSIDSKTVIRGGYGISYIQFFRQGSDSYLYYNGPSVVNAQITQSPSEGLCGPNSALLTCFRTTQMGFPAGFASPANFSTATTKTVFIDPTIRTPYVQNWHFTIQRELAKDWLLDVGYAGNHSVGLWVNEDLNQALPNQAGQSLPTQARRPDQLFQNIDANYGAGFSSYHALQVKVEKRYSQGFTLLNSFTWSKAIDNAAGALEAANGDQQAVNLFDPRAGKGPSGYNQPFNDTLSAVYDLPFGRSRRYAKNLPALADAVLGGWTISGINSMLSGQSINLTYDPSAPFLATDGTKNSAIYRPNVTANPMLPSSQQTPAAYFNKAVVFAPTDVTQPYGNAGRNIVHSSPLYDLDLGIHKRFRLMSESRNLEFRGEVFNALNKTNFSPANGDVSSSSFGKITSTFPARQVQLALRLAF
jgi:Carboxypeptidase regulatory-like domain/TonB-dependent Receptor Plug Domain